MCARVTLTTPVTALKRQFQFTDLPNLPPRYNGAPSQLLPMVRRTADGTQRELVMARWGLVPPWANDLKIGYKMINARAETVEHLPAFRDAFRRRRCLVLADGFYEWQKVGKEKQPYLVRLKSKEPFAFAGLWERWRPPLSGAGGEWVISYTIVTTEANEVVAPLHDRMPVILAVQDHEQWLDLQQDSTELLKPCPADWLEAYPVDRRVGDTRNDDPGLIEPLAASA